MLAHLKMVKKMSVFHIYRSLPAAVFYYLAAAERHNTTIPWPHISAIFFPVYVSFWSCDSLIPLFLDSPCFGLVRNWKFSLRGVGLGWDTLSGTGAIKNTVRRLFDRIWKIWQSVCSVACLFVGSCHRSSVRPTEPSLQVGPKEPLDF